MTQVQISGDPTEEEVAAIVAAVDAATPRGAAPVPSTAPPRWRWSGRWWSRPIPQRRARPW
ncbi:MAG TPA: acyl-CoA carboxylase epsilon subunit [Acidimicrobiales bacterium]|nr:acyl-CoA carboxylase epsilon subunit [Acidimicrobiales bacterium]